MKDFLNNEIKIGDKVVAMRHRAFPTTEAR